MSSEIPKPIVWSAAWRISLWGTFAFAIGTLVVFIFLQKFVSNYIQLRNDAWLWGEMSLLADVAERTPKDALYGQIVGEIAELVRKEVPTKRRSFSKHDNHVFFLQQAEDGSLRLWVGDGSGETTLEAIQHATVFPDRPIDLKVEGFSIPFRVVSMRVEDGSRIFLGLFERDQLNVLNNLRLGFGLLWILIVLFGFATMFSITRRLLNRVRRITDTASTIGQSDLTARVPITDRVDEVSHLALTLNSMLDRIECSMHQLHTMTNSLAHDLRSPLTAIRGRLEASLAARTDEEQQETIISSIEVLDRLTQFLSESLDVAEANAGALRLTQSEVDLEDVLLVMIDLYHPSMAEKGITLNFPRSGPVRFISDAGLIHRMMSNLLDNALAHLPARCTVGIHLRSENDLIILVIEDDGPGFPTALLPHIFERRVKGDNSTGYGLGLAFVDAVVRAHAGDIVVANRPGGGARITISFPISQTKQTASGATLPMVAEE